MERSKRRSRPSMEGLEGRMLLNGSHGPVKAAAVHAAASSSNTELLYTTPQGSKVDIKLTGPGSLAGSTVDSGGNLNLVFSGTTVFTSIIGTVKGGSGQANLATLGSLNVPLDSSTGIGGDLIGRILLPSFNLIGGGQVNLLSGVQVFSLNSVAADSQVHLRDTPLNTSLGVQSYVNTVTGAGSTYAALSSLSTGATTSSASGLSSGSSIGAATGNSSGGVTTIGQGTLNPTAVGFGGGAVGAINGAIPIINTVGNGENVLGTPGLTQTQVNQGRTTTYVVGTDGGTQLSTVAGTFTPGANLIEPSDVSLPAYHKVPPPGVIVTIKHVNGGPTTNSPPLGDPEIFGYDASANNLIRFDATTGAVLQSIKLPASTTGVGGIGLARVGAELVVLIASGSNVLGYDATSGASVGDFSISGLASTGFSTVTGVAAANNMVVLEDSLDGPTGTILPINLSASFASGVVVPSGLAFAPTREFALAGTLTGVPGSGTLSALGSAYLDTTQPNIKQAGILTINPGVTKFTETARTAFTSATTGLTVPAGANNGVAGSSSIALGSLNAFLALDTGVANGMNVVKLYSPNGLTAEGSFTLDYASPLSGLSSSFHPELTNSALIDVQGNIQSFTATTATNMVLNDSGNFDLLQINNASNSTVIGLPFAHVNIPTRNNVVIATNSRLVGTRGGVTVDSTATQVGPLFFD